MKLRAIVFALLSLLLMGSVTFTYTGPGDRTVTVPGITCWRVREVATNDIVESSCHYADDIRPYEGNSKYRIIPYTGSSSTTTYPPAAITASLSACAQPGAAGWCRSSQSLQVSASEPIPGQQITVIDSGAGVLCSIYASSGNCSLPLAEGMSNLALWAISSWGDTSLQALASAKVDTRPPVLSVSAPVPMASGWHQTEIELSASATEPAPGSGLQGVEFSTDGGATWQAGPLHLTEGLHPLQVRARDLAGNQALVSRTEKVDLTPPTLATALIGTPGASGWFVSSTQAIAISSDLTSGLGQTEYRLDTGSWQPGANVTISDGLHQLDFRVSDQAGWVSTVSQAVKVDTMPPHIALSPMGTAGLDGWFTSMVELQMLVTDATSGLAQSEYRLDGGTWQPTSVVELPEGLHLVEVQAEDLAGNVSTLSQTFRIDTTPPSAEVTVVGLAGNPGWYRSAITVSAAPDDQTSGLAHLEARLDDGDWAPLEQVEVSHDGLHQVTFRLTDRAGLQTILSQPVGLDQVPPQTAFQVPLEGSAGTPVHGVFTFQGQSSDLTSGLAEVQLSTDHGLSWQPVSSSSGAWSFVWDTTALPNGSYSIMARATDLAGNLGQTAQVEVLVNNQPPRVSIDDWWWIWESGKLRAAPNAIPLAKVNLRIDCGELPDVVFKYGNPQQLPSALAWDRHCGNGQLAASGDYPVTLTACDLFGNCASAEGTIKVPFIAPPIPSWTPTPLPTATATLSPTPQPHRATPTPTKVLPAPTQAPIPEAPLKTPTPEFWFWPPVALLGLLLAFGSSSLLDPRPAALHRLRKTWGKITDVHE